MSKAKQNHSKWLHIRLKEEEYSQIHKKFEASTCRKLSEYARRALLDKPITVNQRNQSLDDFMVEMIRLRNELQPVGNNFNQAVKRLHTLEKIAEFKSWLLLYDGSRKLLLEKKDKFNRLHHLNLLNQQTKINTVHISLNFDSSDILNLEKLRVISETYMQKIGFGEQPYLVYQHYDAGHPHLHIVTTNIRSDGKRIVLHNLARNASMKASTEIEKEFGLTQALGKSHNSHQLQPVNIQKAQYGKSETKRAITNVLDAVLPHYKYASLAELNAVLRDYNVLADRGSEESRTYRNEGLVYRILNERGEKTGIPIKASLIYNKPTLASIQAKFSTNKENRQQYKQRIRTAVDMAFARDKNLSLPALQQSLKKESIHLHLRQNEAGIIYGLTYVDHRTKCVFNGSDLGKRYSTNAIQQRSQARQRQIEQIHLPVDKIFQPGEKINNGQKSIGIHFNPLQDITQPETQFLPPELREEQKRKRRKRQHT